MVNSPYQDKFAGGSSHQLIGAWVRQGGKGLQVLDIGAATGTMGRLLAESGVELDGLEPHPEWAALARPYYRKLIQASIEDVLQQSPHDLAGYQMVILADVLEHMVAPSTVLRELVGLLPTGARLFISLPNVANIWVRFNLLLGRFDYQDRGILDRTHLHFYTRRTGKTLIEDGGLLVEAVEATPIPLELVHPFFRQAWAGKMMVKLMGVATTALPALLGYQFIYRAKKE